MGWIILGRMVIAWETKSLATFLTASWPIPPRRFPRLPLGRRWASARYTGAIRARRTCSVSGLATGCSDDPADVAGHAALARSIDIDFGFEPDGSERVTLDRAVVTGELRSEEAVQHEDP